jgi:hypothetical protein
MVCIISDLAFAPHYAVANSLAVNMMLPGPSDLPKLVYVGAQSQIFTISVLPNLFATGANPPGTVERIQTILSPYKRIFRQDRTFFNPVDVLRL